MKTIKNLLLVAIIFTSASFAQSGGSIDASDAKSLAMARTYVTSAKGLYALGNNPANLFQDSTKSVELVIPFPLPRFNVNVGTNFMTIDEYNYFFGYSTTDNNGDKVGRYLDQADKDRLKNLFNDGGNISANGYIQIFGISIRPSRKFGTIAFTIGDIISSSVTVPKGLVDLGLEGNLPNTVYNFSDTDLKSWWLRKLSFSYSRPINIFPKFESFTFGISFNIVNGYAYSSIDEMNTELTTGAQNIITGKGSFLAHSAFSPDFGVKYDFDNSLKKEKDVSPFPTPAGKGLGIDFGFNAKVNKTLSIGFAITDIGNIKWTENVAEFKTNKPVYLDDLTSESQRDSLVDALTGKDSGKFIDEITTPLATALRLGFSLQFNNLLLAFDYNQGFNDQPGNSKKPRFSVGADWQLTKVIGLRTGLSFGGLYGFNWGAGLGIDFGILELNFGSPDFQYVFTPNTAKRVTFGIDSKWKF